MTEPTTEESQTAIAKAAGFGSDIQRTGGVGSAAATSREESEIQAAMVIGKRFPRDTEAAYVTLMKSCRRSTFADMSQYSFPRGGVTITGPSINLAVEAARIWGNLRYGLRIVEETEESIQIKGYCLDCETNAYSEFEDRFKKLIQRKRGRETSWVKPDERDLRELIFRRGAILVRNAILRLLPPDIIEDAQREADATIAAAMKDKDGVCENAEKAIRRMTVAFSRIGVTTDMIAARIDHDIGLINAKELVELRKIYASISDGVSRREEYFPLPGASDDGKTGTAGLRASLAKTKGKAGKPPAKPASEPEQTEAPDATPGTLHAADLRRDLKKAVLGMPEEDRSHWMKQVGVGALEDFDDMSVKDMAAIQEALP